MNNLTTLKTRSQESLAHLVDLGKQQPEEVKYWGITAIAALGGALVLTAVAKGVLGVVATLAYPPVALTAGAVGGGLFGWSFMQKSGQEQSPSAVDNLTADADAALAADVVTAPATDAPA